MCLAIPGKITNINGRKVTVQYPGETRDVLGGGMPVEIGDWVMVQMGIVVKKISEKEAKLSLRAWKK